MHTAEGKCIKTAQNNVIFSHRQSNTVALSNSPNYAAFSFPKLNGSPSNHHRPTTLGGINGFPGGTGYNGHIVTTMSGSGSGSGFMGFGPTGFTTPIDTVLDRYFCMPIPNRYDEDR